MHGETGAPCKLPPWKRQRQKGNEGPAALSHDLAYAAFGAGRGRNAKRSREEVGSRTPSQSIVGH